MNARPRTVRSIPFWILIVGSVASLAVGLWLTLDKLGTMTVTITDGSATGVEVYAGQSWAVLGSVLIGTGLLGLALALVVAVVASVFTPREPAIMLADEPELASVSTAQDVAAVEANSARGESAPTAAVIENSAADPQAPPVR